MPSTERAGSVKVEFTASRLAHRLTHRLHHPRRDKGHVSESGLPNLSETSMDRDRQIYHGSSTLDHRFLQAETGGQGTKKSLNIRVVHASSKEVECQEISTEHKSARPRIKLSIVSDGLH